MVAKSKPLPDEKPIDWLAKLPHELTEAERATERTADDISGLRVIGYLVGTILGILIAATIIWTLSAIHQTTERVCPTMDAACQVSQESPE